MIDPLIDYVLLTRQRSHLLAAIENITDNSGYRPSADALEGILNLLDSLSDDAEEAGLLTKDARVNAWREGCIEAGMGDPCDDEEDDD